jgi:hypothetical protein
MVSPRLRLFHRTRHGALQRNHDGQEIEPERLPLPDRFVWLCRNPLALHVRRELPLQGCMHLHQGLRLLDGQVASRTGASRRQREHGGEHDGERSARHGGHRNRTTRRWS